MEKTEPEDKWHNPKISLGVLCDQPSNVKRNTKIGGFDYTQKMPDGMMADCMKFMAKELFKGRMSFDLPVKLNGKYTTIEFVTEFHKFLPNFIEPLCQEKDVLKQLEQWTAHCLAQLNLGFILDEPINSNAGETV